MAATVELIESMRCALKDRKNLSAVIARFQRVVFDSDDESLGGTAREREILRELAYDLDYFEPMPKARSEDPSFYGEDRAINNIEAALEKIRDLVR